MATVALALVVRANFQAPGKPAVSGPRRRSSPFSIPRRCSSRQAAATRNTNPARVPAHQTARKAARPPCRTTAITPPISRTTEATGTWPARRSKRSNSRSTPNGVAVTMKAMEVENSMAVGVISAGHFSQGPSTRQPTTPMATPPAELITSNRPVNLSTRWKLAVSPSASGLAP